MKWETLWPLIGKDLQLFFRDRFFTFITVLGLIFYIGVYWVMPESLDEQIGLGLYAPSLPDTILGMLEDEDEAVYMADTEEDLQSAVLSGDLAAGIVLPETVFLDLQLGLETEVTLYLPSDAPEDIREMMSVLVEAMLLTLGDSPLDFEINESVLGPDMAGQQIPARDRMLPLFITMILLMETLGLSSLIAQEIQTRTIQALLVTPMGVNEVLASKGLTSLLLTFSQAVLMTLAIGGFRSQPAIILAALLLGALMATGLCLLLGSAGKDMLSIMGLGIMVIIALSLPPLGVVFPGIFTAWTRLFPTYYLAEVIFQVANKGAGWEQIWPSLTVLLAVSLALLGVGTMVLKRRFA